VIVGILTIGVFQIDEPEVIESNEEKSVGVTSTLIPETTIINPTTRTVEPQSFEADVVVKELTTQSIPQLNYFQSAHAITSTQSELSYLEYTYSNIGRVIGFDSNHNLATAGNNEISFVNISTSQQKNWVIPNDGFINSRIHTIDVDSSGNIFVPVNITGQELLKLNPNTNEFTVWSGFSGFVQLFLDSNDNAFFKSNGNVSFFDTTTNVLKVWNISSNADSFLDETNQMWYFESSTSIKQLNLQNNVVTTWVLPIPWRSSAITQDSQGNVWFYEHNTQRSKVAQLDPSSNVLTEWVVPNSCACDTQDMAFSNSGDLYILNSQLLRFVPQTETFTSFSGVSGSIIEFDSSDVLWIGQSASFGKLT